MVQMVATDVRPLIKSLQCISERLPLGSGADSKFKLELHLAARDRVATDAAGRAAFAWAGERATRSGRWQSATLDPFASFLSKGCLVVGHEDASSKRSSRPRTARGPHHEGTLWRDSRETTSPTMSDQHQFHRLRQSRRRPAQRESGSPSDFHPFAVGARSSWRRAAPVGGICPADVYKSSRRYGYLLRGLCLVGPGASFRVPGLEAVQMKPRQAPVLSTRQAHGVIARDDGAAPIASVAEASTTLPQLDRVVPRKVTQCDPMSNEISHDIRDHHGQLYIFAAPIEIGTWYRRAR